MTRGEGENRSGEVIRRIFKKIFAKIFTISLVKGGEGGSRVLPSEFSACLWKNEGLGLLGLICLVDPFFFLLFLDILTSRRSLQ